MSDRDPAVTVVALELPGQPSVKARFQPAQLQIDKPVPWGLQQGSKADVPNLRFAAAAGRVLAIRLLLDSGVVGTNVQPELDLLSRMARVIATSGAQANRRPSRVALRFAGGSLPEFVGVIGSLSIQYAAILPDGTPTAATADLRVLEAANLIVSKEL